jgi:hypothetical protein
MTQLEGEIFSLELFCRIFGMSYCIVESLGLVHFASIISTKPKDTVNYSLVCMENVTYGHLKSIHNQSTEGQGVLFIFNLIHPRVFFNNLHT